MFLRSNLHDHFAHSLFRDQYRSRFGENARYEHPGDHHILDPYADELRNLQTREVDSTFQLGLRLSPESEATADIAHAISEVEHRTMDASLLCPC